MLSWMQSHENPWVFPLSQKKRTMEELRRLLREADAELDLRSLRRGALSHMGRKGVPPEQLLQFSGHSSVAMLMRYLRWGWHDGQRQRAGVQAAKLLHH